MINYKKKNKSNLLSSMKPNFEIDEDVKIDKIKMERYVVRDDLIFTGTKQRAALQFIEEIIQSNPQINTLLYTASYNGFGPVVTAYACNKLNLNCILILSLKAVGSDKVSTIQEALQSSSIKKAKQLGAKIIFKFSWEEMLKEADRLSKISNVLWLPLGLKHERFVELLSKNLPDLSFIKRLWVVAGTGAIAKALSMALPQTTIFVVPVINKGPVFLKIVKYLSGILNIIIVDKPIIDMDTPYPSIKGYDSKAWAGSILYGKNGDYVWNVAS